MKVMKHIKTQLLLDKLDNKHHFTCLKIYKLDNKHYFFIWMTKATKIPNCQASLLTQKTSTSTSLLLQ
jgi:hypothetical protein